MTTMLGTPELALEPAGTPTLYATPPTCSIASSEVDSRTQFHNPLAAQLVGGGGGGGGGTPDDSGLTLRPMSARERSSSATDMKHRLQLPTSYSPVQGGRERSSSALALIIPEFVPSPRPTTPVDELEEAQLARLAVEMDDLPGASSSTMPALPDGQASPRTPRTPRLPVSRSNSTSTLYVKTTLQHPDRVGIIYAISKRIYAQVEANSKVPQEQWDQAVSKVPPVFDEYRYRPPQSRRFDVETLYTFIHHVFVMAQMPEACDVPIFALIYLQRIVDTGIPLLTWNWRPLVFCALVVASKVWDDESMWNRSFAKIYPMFTLRDINRMEAEFLQRLDFRMTISAVEYTETYFSLQDEMAEPDPASRTPIDRETARRLEILSGKCEANVQKQRQLRRWDSMRLGRASPVGHTHIIPLDKTA